MADGRRRPSHHQHLLLCSVTASILRLLLLFLRCLQSWRAARWWTSCCRPSSCFLTLTFRISCRHQRTRVTTWKCFFKLDEWISGVRPSEPNVFFLLAVCFKPHHLLMSNWSEIRSVLRRSELLIYNLFICLLWMFVCRCWSFRFISWQPLLCLFNILLFLLFV